MKHIFNFCKKSLFVGKNKNLYNCSFIMPEIKLKQKRTTFKMVVNFINSWLKKFKTKKKNKCLHLTEN